MKSKLRNKFNPATCMLVLITPFSGVASAYETFLQGFYLDPATGTGMTPWINGDRTTAFLTSESGGLFLYSGLSETSRGAWNGGITLWGNPVSIILGNEAESNTGTFDIWRNFYGGGTTPPVPVFRINTATNSAAFDTLNVAITNGSLAVSGSITSGSNQVVTASATGVINLPGTTGAGITANNLSVFTLDAAGKVIYANNRPISITATTVSSSSTTGAMTIAGGLGVGSDSYFNGVRVGRGAGNSSTNTVVGSLALNANTNGQSNTALGTSALSLNTSGNANTALGVNTLVSNTTGGGNTGVGSRALYYNTTGIGNTALGTNALQANTSGGTNAAFGLNSSYFNTVGINNASIGSLSLYNNTTGSNNIALGYGAGRFHANGATQLTDPENSIYIGSNSRGKDNNDNNSIVIGANSVGEGANTTVIGSSATTKTHLYGTVNVSVSIGEALVVGGDTRLEGKVIISVPQGDISMGIYQ